MKAIKRKPRDCGGLVTRDEMTGYQKKRPSVNRL